MNRIKLKHLTLIILLVLLISSAPRINTGSAHEHSFSEPLSVVLLIDISGSMKRTDPQRLRETAAGVFIDMLSPEDYLGVIIFDDQVEIVLPLERVNDFENKRRIKDILYPQLDPRGYTDYVGALETVFSHLHEEKSQGTQPIVIFLTDGEPNPYLGSRDDPAFMAGYMEELWEVVQRYTAERYPIYSVGFSDEIEPEILEKISLDTRGGSYILSNPEDLLVTFFRILGELKNRQIILEETLPEGVERDFSFMVDEFTRQLNIVIASRDSTPAISLFAPDGTEVEPGRLPEVFKAEEEGSTLIVVKQMGEEYWGEWTLSVMGTQPVQVMGDRDLYLQFRLLEPLPYSQQPINEPLSIQVQFDRAGAFQDILLRAAVEIFGLGIDTPVLLPLEEETEGLFTGSFERVNRPGTYELKLQIFREDELLSSTSSTFYARLIPSITTDFYIGEDYVVGDEFIATASLLAAGNRLTEGRDLNVEEFRILITFADGTSEAIPLFDSGNYEEHGDLRARDGIWSNRFILEEPGMVDAFLMASGVYRGTEFLLEKGLGSFLISRSGSIGINTQGTFWSVPGRSMTLPLNVKNDSDLRETLSINLTGTEGTMTQQKITLEPGQSTTLMLDINIASDLNPGNYQLRLVFSSDRESTLLEPTNLSVPVEMISSRTAFLRNYLSGLFLALVILVLSSILFLAIILLGLFLYKINISPQTKVRGSLFYQKSDSTKDDAWQELKFRGRKDKVLITFDDDDQKADFKIEGSDFRYDMEITALWPSQGRRFMQGLRSIRNKYLPVKLMLRCTPPGVIEYAGKIFTEKELLHEDRFESAEFSFHYVNMYAKWYKEKEDGIDLLEGRAALGDYEDSPDL